MTSRETSENPIYIDEPSPWDEEEFRTNKLFENLGLLEAERLLQLAGPDSAEASAWMTIESGPKIRQAILQRRSENGWLTRYFERQALGKTFKKVNAHKASSKVLDKILKNQINKFLNDFGEQIV